MVDWAKMVSPYFFKDKLNSASFPGASATYLGEREGDWTEKREDDRKKEWFTMHASLCGGGYLLKALGSVAFYLAERLLNLSNDTNFDNYVTLWQHCITVSAATERASQANSKIFTLGRQSWFASHNYQKSTSSNDTIYTYIVNCRIPFDGFCTILRANTSSLFLLHVPLELPHKPKESHSFQKSMKCFHPNNCRFFSHRI